MSIISKYTKDPRDVKLAKLEESVEEMSTLTEKLKMQVDDKLMTKKFTTFKKDIKKIDLQEKSFQVHFVFDLRRAFHL